MSHLLTLFGKKFSVGKIGGIQLDLDASDISTITESLGDVSQWDDNSGNINNATQGTGSQQPTTGVDTMNNLNVLDFVAVDSHMFDLDNPITLAADYSIFIVLNTDETTNTRLFLGHSSLNIKIGIVNNNKFFFRALSGGSSDAAETFPSGNSIIHITRDVSNKVDVFFNGDPAIRLFSNVAQSGNTIFDQICEDDGGSNWDGDIAQIAIWNKALTTPEATKVKNLLGNKWGVSV